MGVLILWGGFNSLTGGRFFGCFNKKIMFLLVWDFFRVPNFIPFDLTSLTNRALGVHRMSTENVKKKHVFRSFSVLILWAPRALFCEKSEIEGYKISNSKKIRIYAHTISRLSIRRLKTKTN